MTLIEQLGHVKALCVGDVMLDRFITGAVKRISPESPVPVLSIGKSEAVPGGAANVARNIAALGGQCTLVSVVGQDAVARELKFAIETVAHVKADLVEVASRPTTEKVRFVAQGQHMLRTDVETTRPIDAAAEQALLARIEQLLPGHQVLAPAGGSGPRTGPAAMADLRRLVELRMDPRLRSRIDASDVLQEAYLELAGEIGSTVIETGVEERDGEVTGIAAFVGRARIGSETDRRSLGTIRFEHVH